LNPFLYKFIFGNSIGERIINNKKSCWIFMSIWFNWKVKFKIYHLCNNKLRNYCHYLRYFLWPVSFKWNL